VKAISAEAAAVVSAILAGFTGLGVVVWIASQRVVAALAESSRAAAPLAAPEGARPLPGPANVAAPALPPAPVAATATDLELKARDQVQDAITAATGEYRRLCTKEPVRGVVEFELAFDAEGVEQSRTVHGFGPGVTEALLACLRKQKLAPLHVQAVGHAVTLTASAHL